MSFWVILVLPPRHTLPFSGHVLVISACRALLRQALADSLGPEAPFPCQILFRLAFIPLVCEEGHIILLHVLA